MTTNLVPIPIPPGVQANLAHLGRELPIQLPTALGERFRFLWQQRNHARDEDVALIDDWMFQLARDGECRASILPVDREGFDLRENKAPVRLSLAWTHVAYQTVTGEKRVATGSLDAIVRELADAGFNLEVDVTPNGRSIGFNAARRKYTVQPAKDTGVLYVESLDDAHAACLAPGRYC